MKFKIGDIVKYEIGAYPECDYGDFEPRWNCGTDQGETNRFANGKVINAYSDNFEIEIKDGPTVWLFSYLDSDKPGFPRIVSEKEKQETKTWVWSK